MVSDDRKDLAGQDREGLSVGLFDPWSAMGGGGGSDRTDRSRSRHSDPCIGLEC